MTKFYFNSKAKICYKYAQKTRKKKNENINLWSFALLTHCFPDFYSANIIANHIAPFHSAIDKLNDVFFFIYTFPTYLTISQKTKTVTWTVIGEKH